MTDIQVNNILKDYLNGMSFKRLEYIYKIPSNNFCKDSPTSISGGGIARHIK